MITENPFRLIVWSIGTVVCAILWRCIFGRNHLKPLPPGPAGWPLIGNLLDMPTTEPQWTVFKRWGETWGNIMSISLLGQRMVILNSYKDAVALFEKRSANYSDRPILIVAGQEIGWDEAGVLCRYGDALREQRRAYTHLLGTRKALEQFTPIIEDQARQLLIGLLEHPQHLQRQLKRVVAALTLEITHGYHVKEDNDLVVQTVNQVMEDFSEAFLPGRFAVDLLPSLQYIPAWFPGTGWKTLVAQYKRNITLFHELSYRYVKKEMAAGTATPSFLGSILEPEMSLEKENTWKWAAAALFAAGSDTTVSAMATFFLAMVLFPEVQQRAQREIDTVIGTGQLPLASDRERLPYVNALCLEVMRWQPVLPLGAPRRNMEDDIYNGYFFPKGTTFIANAWNMLHDPEIYANPFAFNPERYLLLERKEPELDPRQIAFGFSRRICPGLQLADWNMFVQCAMSLAVFDVSKAIENGQIIEPRVEYTTLGSVSHPLPFKYSLKPRNAKAEALIRQVKLEYE
ncbi:cytochrome P450 [Obba rivulosa]|uniref:Cytochrome P450 n=1 Tax=Obba rivulosa TaxID=1052685 RepID=A0A8E2AP57_9APHY|nr:cytochrome P450 [Obba rivulosa]